MDKTEEVLLELNSSDTIAKMYSKISTKPIIIDLEEEFNNITGGESFLLNQQKNTVSEFDINSFTLK